MKKYMIDCDMNLKIFLAARKISPENYTVGCPPMDAFGKALAMLNVSAQRIAPSQDGFEVDMEEYDFQILTEKCAAISIRECEDYLDFMERRMDIPPFDSAHSCQSFKPPISHSMSAASTTAVTTSSNAPSLATQALTAKTPTTPPKG